MIKHIFILLMLTLTLLGLTQCSTSNISMPSFTTHTSSSQAAPPAVSLQGFPNDPAFWQADTSTVWYKLQHISLKQLQSTSATDPTNASWIQLAIISKQYSTDSNQLITQLMSWRAANPNHPANSLFPDDGTLNRLQNTPPPKHIALLLPLQGSLGSSGQTVRDGFLNAYYASALKSQQTVSFYDTNQNSNIGALYQKALAEGADTVIGPLTKDQVQTLISQSSFAVPTLALNYTDGSLPTNLYEFGLSPLDEAQQLADHARQAGLSRALIIAPQDDWGQRVLKTLIPRWQSLGGSITDTFYFTPQTDLKQGIANLLHASAGDARTKSENNISASDQQRRHDFDVIFLLASPTVARQIVPYLKYYYVTNVPIFSTSIVYTGKPSSQDSDLNGITFSDIPWMLSSNAHMNRLYAVGRDSYLLSTQIARMNQLPNFPLYGATGALTLTPQHQIYRRLAWVQMRK